MNQLIIETIKEVMVENGRPLSPLEPGTRLLTETSLDSLDVAVLIIKLEEKTGKDPFAEGFIPFSTIQELAHLYEK